MRPTRVSVLVALLVAVAVLTWGVLRIVESRGGVLPPLAWTAPTFIAVIAAAVLATWLAVRSRRRSGRLPNPFGMARMAVLGKASAHVGPLVGGLYLGYLSVLVTRLEVDSRRDGAVICVAALVASVVLSVAGLLLERSCRISGGEADDDLPSATA